MNRPGADARPRIHVWPHNECAFSWSIGPTGARFAFGASPGECVDAAYRHLGNPASAVVILEPREERKSAENGAF